MTIREFIRDITCERGCIDLFLSNSNDNWARFDPELGYVLNTCSMRDGIDNSYTQGTYMPGGERKMTNYAKLPCRINTYGDSFTQCHQVSDGETWQEYLAAHICEPVRNFGVGGYGVWQAYRRLARHEAQPDQRAEYIIFNIFSDDHKRSIDRWRWIRIDNFRREVKEIAPGYFHATPWTYLRLNPDTLAFEAFPSLCPTPESLYNLCDEDFLYGEFAKDAVAHMYQAQRGGEFDRGILRATADMFDFCMDFSDADASARSAAALYNLYALKSSEFVLDLLIQKCRDEAKKLLLITSYAAQDLLAAITGQPRFDSALLDYIARRGIPCVDMGAAHTRDFEQFSIDASAYIKRYYIRGYGHYAPQGNHFCAFEVKPALVDMLEPKPSPYRGAEAKDSSALAARLA